MTKVPWIGTSWKMNKTRPEARRYCETLRASWVASTERARLFVVPPATAIAEAASHLEGTRVRVGAQNMHWDLQGAWTGEISAGMVKECGATFVELGHSERREFFNETDDAVGRKVETALSQGLMALVCVGDTHEEFRTGTTAQALERQVSAALSRVDRPVRSSVLIAYEPVWSIGERGVPAEPDFVAIQHGLLKDLTKRLVGEPLDILYGGSVSAANCEALAAQADIDGLFIGRAAWDAAGFIDIVERVVGPREG